MLIIKDRSQAAAETNQIISVLKRLNDGKPGCAGGRRLDIRFLEELADEELISGGYAFIGEAIEAEVPGALGRGFVSDFAAEVELLADAVDEALAGFDGADPATWCVRRVIDLEPENTNPHYRNKFFELSHCLLNGEMDSGMITMPVRSRKSDLQTMHHPLESGSAFGFEYRECSDHTVIPISWGEGIGKAGKSLNAFIWPCGGPAGGRPRPPDDAVAAAEEVARKLSDEPVRIPLKLPNTKAIRIPVFLGNAWDPRRVHRHDNSIPSGLFAFV